MVLLPSSRYMTLAFPGCLWCAIIPPCCFGLCPDPTCQKTDSQSGASHGTGPQTIHNVQHPEHTQLQDSPRHLGRHVQQPSICDLCVSKHICVASMSCTAGDRYSTDKVKAQLARTWGQDAGSAIQPRIYMHPSTSQLELPESASVRVLAGQPVLSDLFVPFQQSQQVTHDFSL